MAALWILFGGFIVLLFIITIRTLTFGEKIEEVERAELVQVYVLIIQG